MAQIMRRLRATAIAGILLSTTACTVVSETFQGLLGLEGEPLADTDAFDTDWDEELEGYGDVPQEARRDVGAEIAEPNAVLPLDRSEKRLPLPAHGSTSMGFRVDQLAEVYALAGALEVPAWSAVPEGSPRLLRDDDLDTAWTCVPNSEERCAVGMHFPTAAKIHSLRLFGAAIEFETYPRPKRVRVHTELGFSDILLADNNAPQFMEFVEPVLTRNVIIEILEVFPGNGKDPKIHLADLEVFGVSGTAREPLALDPAATVAVSAGSPWHKAARSTYTREEMFLHWVDESGAMHRFMEGTALRGQAGDRLLLVERVSGQSDCDAPRGTFYLLDTQTRVTAPLGDLDGVGGDTFRASDGQGIVIGFKGKLDTKLNGVFAEDDKYRRRQTPFRADQRTDDYFSDWKLDPEPLLRAAPPLNETIESCTTATESTLAELAAAKAASATKKKKKPGRSRKRRGEEEVPRPASWQVCTLTDGARAFLTDHGPCGSSWELTVVDADGSVVATEADKSDRAFLRVARLAGKHLLVQTGDGSDATTIWRVAADGILEVSASASFAIQPPASCRENCLEPFPNPGAPVWQ